ncbi:autotransporter outer membrane beta-barrel domain-containing protein [Snodgrassella alvi]|uniref:autotransporter outer membrane beta-barrel domain-containing protein n=1 Tax=Snodgrassella alvi TaxID=1196083 RepID=UPI00351C05D8
MNNIYKSKWSEATQTWVACSELVRGKTKNNCAKIAAAVALALTSLGSYAADPAPCDNNAGSVVVSGTKCSLPSLPDDKTYTEISASGGAELIGEEGKKITAIGTTKVKKVINVDGGSTLNATNITTTNRVNSKGTNALAIAGSSIVDIDENLTATNMGNKADTIVNSGGSTLTVGKDLTINDEKGFSNGIQNIENSTIGAENITITSKKVGFSNDGILNKNNSVIDVKQNIDITSEGSDGNASIENTDGGKIKANNINIIQGGKNYAIHQTSENSSITVNNDLTIKSGNIPEGNSTIKIEGGKINVKGKTTINTHVDPDFIDDPKKVSAISITDGTYEANGGANINIKDNDEKNFEDAAGVIIGNKGIFENNGTLTVNGGKNTVIATDLESGEEATFTNKADGITTSHADTIVHNSSGILTVNNDGTLYSDGDSVLKNNKNGDIVVNNNEASSVINGNIINTKDGNITVNNKNSASTITGNITNQDNGTVTINNSGKIQNDNTRNKIENSGTGSMDITNTGTIASDILNGNTGDITINNNKTSSVVNGETDYTNPTTINGDIINNNDGNITVNNNESTSFIKGGITNSQKGSITINNSGSISGSDDTKKITNSNDGEIIINNNHEGSFLSDIENDATSTGLISIKNEGHVVSHISNKNTGIIQIINKDSFGGSIENTGDILINNYNAFGSTINNDGNGTIVINNNENSSPTDRSSIYGVINNNQSGNITVNNNGNESVIDSDINNNAENGNITVNNNTDSAIISGNITNSQAGSITINNSGLTVLYRKVTNSGAGKINITNNDKGNFQSAIDNDATSTGMIILDNQGTVNSTITNKNTGAIKITNTGTLGGSIKNTGTQRVVGNNWIDNIWIDNNKDLKSNIENLNGSIVVNNNKEGSSFTGNIHNNSGFNTGKITVNNNEENTKINSHITNDNGDITINNKAYSSTIEGDITNKNHGRVTIKNSGKVGKTGQDGEADTFLKITNSGGSINIKNDNDGDFLGNIDNDNDATGTGFIDIYNNGNTFKGSITNQNTGTIDITNRGKNFDGSITNQNTGNISITNDTTLNSTITNTGDKRTNGYNIEITNNKELNGSIKNEGTGDIHIKNTKDTSSIISRIGRITGEITNNNTGTIILDNDGEIASAILNGGAGAINIANTGTLNGSITNTGDKINDNTTNVLIKNNKDGFINGDITNSGAGNISIKNQDKAVLNGNIKNDGSGSITFTNNGDVDASVVNNTSVRINDTSLRQIQNIGNGTITIINNKTLNRPISNASEGTIGITNNGTMKTDITNTKSSTGEIEFINTQEFEGNLINANTGFISALNTKNFTGITDNSDSGKINLDNQGIWNNTGNSVLTKLQNTTGTIIFPKVSEVNAGDKDQYHTITVNGNYTGGGLMRVNTVWNKDGTSYSDRVDIHGDVDGAATTVQTLNGIYGDVTLKEIPIHSAVVVHVAGKSSGNDFTGSAPTTNAGEAQLKKIDTTSGTDYAWTLTAQNKTPEPTNPSVSGPTDPNISEPTDPNVSGPTDPNISEPTAPDKPILPAPPITEVPIYAEPVSGYVQMPTADMELGFTTIGTLHERRGENQTYNITGSNNTALGSDQQQTWGRVLVKHLDKDGKKRLDTAGNQSVLQIGHDFILDENEKTGIRRHIGGYVAYGHNENDFRDQYRAKNGYIVDDHYTGKGRTDAVSVGGYGTFYGNNGGYVDLVGQVTYLRNKYNARSNESVHQNGWGAALSAETGKSFIVYGNNWFVEPQAQLVYQYLSLDDFNDRIRHVDQHDPSALRGRVGMRFGYNGDTRDNLPSSSFYGIANIWHDFVNPKSVDIGRDKLKEDYAKTWGEVGLGIQLPITRQSNFYSDIRYEKNFGSDKRKGFKGTIGYKYTWL